MSRVAVIGAGLAGLVIARELAAEHDVVVFDKARGVGGRLATRYAGVFEFDHGAQFFAAHSRDFRRYLEPLLAQRSVAPWCARFVELTGRTISAARDWDHARPHYVGVPRMNAAPKALAADLEVTLATRIAALEHDGRHWRLRTEAGDEHGGFDWVVSTAPAPQTAALLPAASPLVKAAAGAGMRACYALMLGFETPPADPGWQAARVLESDLSWISVNSSKPGRGEPFTLVVHSTNAWADAHIDDDADAVRNHLLNELERVTGFQPGRAVHVGLQRWRYANLPKRRAEVQQVDAERRLAVCGDWCVRGRVEAAYRSAARLAGELRPQL